MKRIQKKKGKGRYAMAVAGITVLGLVAFGIFADWGIENSRVQGAINTGNRCILSDRISK